jgi:hypothetical protein
VLQQVQVCQVVAVEGDLDGCRLRGTKAHIGPSDQSLGGFAGGFRQLDVRLGQLGTGPCADVAHGEPDPDRPDPVGPVGVTWRWL